MNLHGEREITAWLRDSSSPGLRSIWVRLVPRGKVPDGLDTWQIPECHVDFDEEGQPTGIQLFLFKDTPRAKEPKDIIIQGLRAALDLAIEAEGDLRARVTEAVQQAMIRWPQDADKFTAVVQVLERTRGT